MRSILGGLLVALGVLFVGSFLLGVLGNVFLAVKGVLAIILGNCVWPLIIGTLHLLFVSVPVLGWGGLAILIGLALIK